MHSPLVKLLYLSQDCKPHTLEGLNMCYIIFLTSSSSPKLRRDVQVKCYLKNRESGEK